MAALVSYLVIDWNAGTMAAGFSSLTPVSGWTQQASRTPRSIDDTVPAGTVLETDAEFAERCGWTFDHWRITMSDLTAGTESVSTSQDNPVRHILSALEDGRWYSVTFEAFGVYNGTGKILVSCNDHTKAIRTADAPVKIFIDQ